MCAERSLRSTFEEAKTEHTFEVLKCLGPAKCPLTQKCTRPSSGTPNVTVAIGFFFHVHFRTPRYTDLHTPLFGGPKWHRSNKFYIFSGPRYTDLQTSVRSMDWMEATQSITNLKGHRNSPPPSQFRVLTCWVHLVLVHWNLKSVHEVPPKKLVESDVKL